MCRATGTMDYRPAPIKWQAQTSTPLVKDCLTLSCVRAVQKPGESLLVELDQRRIGRPTTGEAVAAQWFAQDLFKDADLGEDEEDLPQPASAKKQKVAKAKQTVKPSSAAASVAPSVVAAQLPGAEAVPAAARLEDDSADVAASSSADESDEGLQSESSSSDDDEENQLLQTNSWAEAGDKSNQSGFEEVPVSRQHGDGSSDESSDDGFDDLDDDGRAEVLALAKKMLKGRDRQDILDNAYHKYAFHETGLPRWFEEDEKRHMQ